MMQTFKHFVIFGHEDMSVTTEKYNLSAKEYYSVYSSYNPTAKPTVPDYDTTANC